jgi:NADH dehydrogenase FAD-containing subunit
MADKKRIVVVGGGVAGTSVARSFDTDSYKLTLIDPKDFFEVPYARLRCIVEPKFAERSIMKHSEYLKKGTFLETSAKSVSGQELVTESGERVPFDFLIIGTGTTFSGPTTKEELLKFYQAENARLQAAETVLIIGGGPVGVELAGEIATDFPNKKVTLVHGGERLVEFLGPKASTKALKWLQSKKVTVMLNDRIDTEGLAGPDCVTKKGQAIKADAHFVCVGKLVGSSWLKGSDLESAVDSNGRVMVDRNMRVQGHSNIFAVGDVSNTKEIKQGYLATKQAAVVTENIKKSVKDPFTAKLTEYNPATAPFAIVSLGRNLGLMQMPLGTFVGRLPGMLKSKDLFVGSSRKALGLSA